MGPFKVSALQGFCFPPASPLNGEMGLLEIWRSTPRPSPDPNSTWQDSVTWGLGEWLGSAAGTQSLSSLPFPPRTWPTWPPTPPPPAAFPNHSLSFYPESLSWRRWLVPLRDRGRQWLVTVLWDVDVKPTGWTETRGTHHQSLGGSFVVARMHPHRDGFRVDTPGIIHGTGSEGPQVWAACFPDRRYCKR